MLTIPEDELDFADEYDPMHEVYYQSEPFTGIAKTALETTEYLNGTAHGHYELRFTNGTLSAEGTYVNGECTAMRSWYEDGTLRYTDARTETKRWDRDGVLAYWSRENADGTFRSSWYYKNGVVKQEYTAQQGTDYFAPDGQLAMQVRFGPVRNSVQYTDEALKSHYMAILTNYHYEQEAGKETVNTEWYFWGWWWRTLKQDEATARHILNQLDRAGFHTAGQILENLRTIDIDVFQPGMGYSIVD